MPDFTKTVIYKIVCNDLSVTDLYVGSTTNFTQRKTCHKKACNCEGGKMNNTKIYATIREKGGWENWTMVIIEPYSCENGNQARTRERALYEELHATLNSIRPHITDEEKRQDSKHYRTEHVEERRINSSIYKENHKEELRNYHAIYYANNAEELRVKNAIYYVNNAEELRAKQYIYNANHREEQRLKAAIYRKKNVDAIRVRRVIDRVKYKKAKASALG